MMNISSNIVKRIGFSFAFLTLISVAVSAQDYKIEKKGRNGYKWSKPLVELKVPVLDTLQRDSLPLSEYYGVRPIEIPNVYSGKAGVGTGARMPVLRLSGKNCAPMPGTEKLDEVENYQNPESSMKTMPLLIIK
jgi:hypothetical protein